MSHEQIGDSNDEPKPTPEQLDYISNITHIVVKIRANQNHLITEKKLIKYFLDNNIKLPENIGANTFNSELSLDKILESSIAAFNRLTLALSPEDHHKINAFRISDFNDSEVDHIHTRIDELQSAESALTKLRGATLFIIDRKYRFPSDFNLSIDLSSKTPRQITEYAEQQYSAIQSRVPVGSERIKLENWAACGGKPAIFKDR